MSMGQSMAGGIERGKAVPDGVNMRWDMESRLRSLDQVHSCQTELGVSGVELLAILHGHS